MKSAAFARRLFRLHDVKQLRFGVATVGIALALRSHVLAHFKERKLRLLPRILLLFVEPMDVAHGVALAVEDDVTHGQYSSARMTVSTLVVTLGSLGSGEWYCMARS